MKKFASHLKNVQLGLGIISISLFFVVIIIQVFSRYLGITVLWTGELSTYSFIWSVFMGAGVMTYENKHFSFTSVIRKIVKKNIKYIEYIELFISIIILMFSLSIFYYGIIISNKFWNYRWINISEIKMGYTWLCVPILGGTNSIYSLSHIFSSIDNMRNRRN